MEQNPKNETSTNKNTQTKGVFKYIPNKEIHQVIKDISNPIRKKILNQYKIIKKPKNENINYRYNTSLDKKIEFINDTNLYSDRESETSNIEENQDIFTRIKSNLNYESDSRTKNKNKNVIYKKVRTPDRKKYTYYKKRNKKDSTDNTYSISYFTESNIPKNPSNIYDSLEEINNQKPIDFNKKINKLIKHGLKFELNNDNETNYIDLLTIEDIKTLENKINLKRLSKMNKINNNNIYVKKHHPNEAINFNKNKKKKNKKSKRKSRNTLLSSIINENKINKSYDCITFKKKIGINKKRKLKNKNMAKSTDNIFKKFRKSKGTPIKKENDKGGKIVLSLKSFYKNNNTNNDNKEYNNAAALIQKRWKLYNKDFIKKVCLIQKMFRNLLNKRKNEKNIKLIQHKYRKHLIDKKQNKQKEEQEIKPDKEKIKKENNNIRTIRNGNYLNNNENNNKGKKHRYTRSKLALSPINKIFISQDIVRYDTNRYTFLKKCYFRNRKEDQEQNEINKSCTTEFMRKIELKLKGNYLTPDKNQKRIINPLLKIDKLGEEANIQFLSKSQDKNNENKDNKENKHNNYNNNNNILSKENRDNINYNKNKEEEDLVNTSDKINDANKDNNNDNDNKDNIYKIDNIENINIENINNLDTNKDEEEKNENKKDDIKMEELVQPINNNIPEEYITKCKIGEIIIKKTESKCESDFKEKESENYKKLEKIIFLQKNIKIFLEKLKPKITKAKKTILIMKDDKNELEQNDSKKLKSHNKNNKIIQNVDTIEYLNNNEEDLKKKEDITSENSSIKENINENEIIKKPKQDREEYFSKINIIKNKPVKEETININKMRSKPKTIIKNINLNSNNEEKYIIKKPGITYNITNPIKNKDEIIYINKKPSKAYNITNQINDKDELLLINKKPSKTIIKENIVYNKLPSKVNVLIKNVNNNLKKEETPFENELNEEKDIIKNIQNKENNNEEITSGNLDIDYTRYSCPLKEIKKINYKKYKNNLDIRDMFVGDNDNNNIPFKLIINQLKEIGAHYKYFKFDYIVKMFLQKIFKINKQFVFGKIKGKGFEKHNNFFFDIIRTYLNNKDLYINDNNDVSKLLKETLQFYISIYEKYNFIPYIKEKDEDKLINTQLFRYDENGDKLVSFITKYLKLEKNLNKFTPDLIKYYLNKKRIKNFNIFGITRYMNNLSFWILYSKVDISELKKKENLNIEYITINSETKEEEINENIIENDIEINLSNYVENKAYKRKTINYKKANKLKIKRHVMNLSSCDIDNNSYDNLPHANDSLIKKSLVE